MERAKFEALVLDITDIAAHGRHLNQSQRAIIAARLVTGTRGGDRKSPEIKAQRHTLTANEAANLLNVSRATVFDARMVLKEGTPEQVSAVELGRATVGTLSKKMRARHNNNNKSLHLVGKNPERIQTKQLYAEIWGRVRDSLTHLTSLPSPADAARIVRGQDRAGLVDARLEKAIKWLGEFSDAWNTSNRDEAAS